MEVLYDLQPPPFIKNDGMVIYAGTVQQLPQALILAKQIRGLGSELPLEIIVDEVQSETDTELVEAFNIEIEPIKAKCLVISLEFGSSTYKLVTEKGTNARILGLFVSLFDNIISLDVNTIPVKNLDKQFTSKPFMSTKWVFWPNLWHRTTSPLYYELAGFETGEIIRRDCLANDVSFANYVESDKSTNCGFHDLQGLPPAASVDVGQMVFLKRAHYRSFLLSLYYNIHGKSYYDRLLYQGEIEESERELFIPALHVFNEAYHLNRYLPQPIEEGSKRRDLVPEAAVAAPLAPNVPPEYSPTPLIQHDSLECISFFNDWKRWLAAKKLDSRLLPFQQNSFTSKLFLEFMTTHTTRHNEHFKMEDGTQAVTTVVTPYKLPTASFIKWDMKLLQDQQHRQLGTPSKYQTEFEGSDWELELQKIDTWVKCEGLSSKFWALFGKEQETICNLSQARKTFLEQTKIT